MNYVLNSSRKWGWGPDSAPRRLECSSEGGFAVAAAAHARLSKRSSVATTVAPPAGDPQRRATVLLRRPVNVGTAVRVLRADVVVLARGNGVVPSRAARSTSCAAIAAAPHRRDPSRTRSIAPGRISPSGRSLRTASISASRAGARVVARPDRREAGARSAPSFASGRTPLRPVDVGYAAVEAQPHSLPPDTRG